MTDKLHVKIVLILAGHDLNHAVRRMLYKERKMSTIPEHLSTPPFFRGVCVARLCVCIFVLFVLVSL